MLTNPRGALPLSLFGEIEVENDHSNAKLDGINHDLNFNKKPNYIGSNGWFDPKKNAQNNVSGNGSGLDLDNFDDDVWEFRGAICENNDVVKGNVQVQGSSSGAKVEKMVMNSLENQAWQDDFSSYALQSNGLFENLPMDVNNSHENYVAFKSTNGVTNDFMWDSFPGAEDISNDSGIIDTATSSTGRKPGLSSSLPESRDLFVDSLGANNISNGMDVGRKSTAATSNGFSWDAYTGVEKIGNGSESSDTPTKLVEQTSSSFPPSDDLFPEHFRVVDKSSEMDDGLKQTSVAMDSSTFDVSRGLEKIGNRNETTAASIGLAEHKPSSNGFLSPLETTSMTTNGFMFDTFSEAKVVDNENASSDSVATATINDDDDFDDFGDFIDAFQEVGTQEQDKPTLLINSRGALPLSLFGDSTKEITETVNNSDELVHKPTFNFENSSRTEGSVISIHDLISNLYGQAPNTGSITSDGKRAENIAHNSQGTKSLSLDDNNDEWDDNDEWEFKDASQEAVVEEKLSNVTPGNVAHIQLEASQHAQNYIAFYTELRDSLCFLLSCQLDELRQIRCKDTELLDDEIQEVQKLLEQNLISQDVSENYPNKGSCLNEVLKTLKGPGFEMIESEYSLSEKLQLAVNDWRVAADLLKHAISFLKTLSLATSDERSRYIFTWFNIINACAQELRYASLIWKTASVKNVQHQVLSDCRGQKNIQALGEIYKVAELLGLSVKVYKAWMLFSMSDSSQFMNLLNECRASWKNSGLEETLQNLSDDADFGCDATTKAILDSVKNIRNFDVLAMHGRIIDQQKPFCRLSLLPQEMLPDLKTVLWDGQPYFVSLANLWANLISLEPPQLLPVQPCQPYS